MKGMAVYISFIVLLAFSVSCIDSEMNKPACRVEDNRVIFRIDTRWSESELKEFSLRFALDSVLLDQIYSGAGEINDNGIIWKARKAGRDFIDLSRPLENIADSIFSDGYVFMFPDGPDISDPGNYLPDDHGINVMYGDEVFSYSGGVASFRLPGHRDAASVFLSGTFNNWSTNAAPMTQTDTGWIATIKLEPGKYAYKYIVDGEWTSDPGNALQEDDLNGDFNSVIYCYNHTFRLNGMNDMQEVRVTGDFLNWTPSGIPMKRIHNGWELSLYMREGEYLYKFVSGSDWFIDPVNPDIQVDAGGNRNSVVSIGEKYTFNLPGFSEAHNVIVTGTFNGWKTNEKKMKRSGDGWSFPVALSAGNYEYKFIVDGRWMPDPDNQFSTGSGDYTNSLLAFRPNHLFTLKGYENAGEVMVTGSFNNFSNPGYRMVRKDGTWTIPVFLKPGKTIYKFIVDGEWILDPANELWEENKFGTGNSVLWIDPYQADSY